MDAPPVGGFGVRFFIKVRWLRLAFFSGAPLTVTLGFTCNGSKPYCKLSINHPNITFKVKMKKSLLISLLALAPITSYADGIVAGLGYAQRDSIQGLEIELGYRKSYNSWAVNIMPLTGILSFGSNTDSTYREETFDNGTTVCRDHSNGQFANKEKCNNIDFDYAAILSADYSLTEMFALGAGVRVGNNVDAFGTLRAKLSDIIAVQVNGSPKYFSANVLFDF
jgi:hypothetical protein